MNRCSISEFRGRVVSEACCILPDVESSKLKSLPRARVYASLYEFSVMALFLAVHALFF
jgi:hypothetical protein